MSDLDPNLSRDTRYATVGDVRRAEVRDNRAAWWVAGVVAVVAIIAVVYMVTRDRRVAVNEILVRSAEQTW